MQLRKSGRAAECVCLENRITCEGNGGSNPSSSDLLTLRMPVTQEIITYINQILRWDDAFPEEALMHLIDREEEAKPALRDILAQTLEHYKEVPEDYVGHIYALYLLAQFRDTQALKYALGYLELPEPYPGLFFHDLLTQSYPAVIASCYGGDPGPIYALIQNQKLGFLSRVIPLVAASILVSRKTLSRDDFVHFLQTLLKESDKKFLAVVAEEVATLHLGELYSAIKELYAQGAIDEEQYSLALFEAVLQSDYANPRRFFLIDDAIEELNGSS